MNPKQMTLEEYEPEIFRRQSVGVSAHPVRTSVLQGFEQDLTETEARWCERFSDSLKKRKKKIDPNGLSMRMLEGCCQAIEDGTLPRFSLSFTGGGMTSNGEYSTQSFSVSHRIGKECTLSDILEDTVDAKYFLSDTAVKALTSLRDAKVEPLLPPIRERERERDGIIQTQYANTLTGKDLSRRVRGVYLMSDGTVLRVNGYHKK